MLQTNEELIDWAFSNSKSVFNTLSEEEKRSLRPHIEVLNYKRGSKIYWEGEEPSGFLFLLAGKVKIFKEGVGGREQIVRMTKPLGYVGYRALIAQEIHNACAVSIEESKVLRVKPDYFFNQLLKNNDFTLRLLRKLSEELGFSNSRTVTLTQKHIRGRMAEALLLLKRKYGFEQNEKTLRVLLTREDLAKLSNMTTANAIRTLSSFAKEELILVEKRKVSLLNLSELENISTQGKINIMK
ncbi:MAG: Crp/Fnr family transcriptional regulator [Mangrovibacterium sp.]